LRRLSPAALSLRIVPQNKPTPAERSNTQEEAREENQSMDNVAVPVTALMLTAIMFVLLVAVGAWLAIRFEKWRESRNRH
jgi:hypothetical protein